MDAPVLYKPHPALFPSALLGGFAGTVLLTALIRLLDVLGLTVVDLPAVIGSVFAQDAATIFTLGHALFVTTGVFVLPLGLALLWPLTPGDRFTFRGALIKGSLWGVALFIMAGILLPLVGILTTSPDFGVPRPGAFALALGPSGPVQLLLGTQLYSLTSALVAQMPRGLQPLDAVGWGWWSHGSGEAP